MAASRSGVTAGAEVVNLAEVKRELKAIEARLPKELRIALKVLANEGARRSQTEAQRLGGVQAKAAPAIKGYATATSARIGVNPGRSYPMANIAFWGAKKRTGWYAAGRYDASPPQHPPWVGSNWDPGVRGQGPLAINDALAEYMPGVPQTLLDAIDRIFTQGRAFAF